ncbi:MAG: signal peptidase I [Erythrobacter sp.]
MTDHDTEPAAPHSPEPAAPGTGGAGGTAPAPPAREEEKEKVNWFAEARGLALMLLVVLAFHSLVAKPFYIPSASMMPTLWVGDRLIVTKYPYGWSWASASFHLLPRGDWRIWPDTPEYGDIVIPVHPIRNEDYIKRVVALPGDTIELREGRIILNGTPIEREQVASVRLPLEPELYCNRIDGLSAPCLDAFEDHRVTTSEGTFFEPPTFRETLPNGATYLVIDHERVRFDDHGPVTVPEGHVFVMGDNRDHSADSRASIAESGLGGPVPLENIGGRAEFITFSLDGSTTWNPLSWFSSLRENRAWTTLRPAIAEGTAVGEAAKLTAD